MTRYAIPTLAGLLLSLFLLAGCAANGKAKPIVATVPVCQQDFNRVFKDFNPGQSAELLRAAQNKGCWDSAVAGALEAKIPLSETELAKALKYFNRQETMELFDQTAENYFTALAEGRIAYGVEQQRFLEAYSRNAINNARSQNSQQLRLVQQVSWRLDRVMYARLFE